VLDELEASRASRKRAWEILQEIRWVLKDTSGTEAQQPVRKTIDLEGIVASIALWNTVYLERAILALRQQQLVDDALLKYLSPLGWEHINLTGDYVWHANKRVAAGRFRPLRYRRIQKA
jgi:hypothetical protein